MKRRPWNIVFHELVGLKATVLAHSDPTLIGVVGTVVEETEKTLVVKTGDGRLIRILKPGGLFAFTLPGGDVVVVRGEDIVGAPAERLKRLEKGRGVARLVRSAKHRYSWPQAARKNMQ